MLEEPKRESVDLSGLHILVVEDADDARDALRMIFQFYGAKVRAAASAEEGARLLLEDRPDIMVSDIAMPDDGIELIRAVKASADARDLRIPVIAITAHRYRGEELLAEGFAELVEKPFDPAALCRVILRHTQAYPMTTTNTYAICHICDEPIRRGAASYRKMGGDVHTECLTRPTPAPPASNVNSGG